MSENLILPAEAQPARKTPRHVKTGLTPCKIRKLSIIIPCYNEASTISIILDKIADTDLPNNIEKEVIVVNDFSRDDTDLMVREYVADNPILSISYLAHQSNLGKGAAIQTALTHATGEYVIIQDADLEYDPSEYSRLLRPILSGHADIVYGSRFMGGQPHRILFFWHTLGNKILTFISNLVTNMNLTDAHTCYKLLPTTIVRHMPLQEKRFAFDSELNVRISHLSGIRIYEVGISYYGRTFSEGKKIRMRDAFRSVLCLLKYGLFARKQSPISEIISHQNDSLKLPVC